MKGKAKFAWWKPLATPAQVQQLLAVARQRRWGLVLIMVGWLHLLAFSLCHYLSVVRAYHDAAGYLAIWVAELLAMGLIFRLCGGTRPLDPPPLEPRTLHRPYLGIVFSARFQPGNA